jgi:AcrR family transcriptional regulator
VLTDTSPTSDRADRILDAAGDLLLRLGYRKVTIEDVAQRAGIGKGTVYLH